MNPIILWSIMAGVIVVLAGVSVFLAYKVLEYRNNHKANVLHRREGLLEDLELATSDQLLTELRKRPGVPYLMLSPIEGEEHKGMSIEIHNIPPIPCLQMLHIATALTFRELKARGMEVPDFEPPPVEGDEWKHQ